MHTTGQNLYFTYDGISCKNFKLMQVNLSGGMFEEQFVADRDIIETKIKGNDTPLFHSVEENPLEFDLTIAFEDFFTNQDIDNVIAWLFQDNYKPLVFEDKPNKIYYCMPVGSSRIFHNGLKQGYVTVKMRNKSSKVLSQPITSQVYDLSNNTGTSNITLSNLGHLEIYPEISIEKITAGKITIIKNGEIFEITGLTNLEKIYINSEKEIIHTDLIGTYRYNNVIGDFDDLIMTKGINVFGIQGKCKISFRYQYKYKM